MRHRRHLFISLIAAVALFSEGTYAGSVKVVTSIKPLELLVRAVATEAVEVMTLVPAGSSPHTYQMRPSERRALAEAQLVFWVGPAMETFLARILNGEDFKHRTYALAPTGTVGPDIDRSEHDEDNHKQHDNSGHHQHGDGEDPHVWLDPGLALTMTETIQDRLAEQPGIDRDQLRRNLDVFRQRLKDTEQSIRTQLKAAQGLSLFTYHNAFSRFAEHYGLTIAGVLTPSPERTPGARHIAEIQSQLKGVSHPCLLSEPQFTRQWWQSITEGVNVTVSTWDPLASNITSDAEGYLRHQQQLADAVLACLPEYAQH